MQKLLQTSSCLHLGNVQYASAINWTFEPLQPGRHFPSNCIFNFFWPVKGHLAKLVVLMLAHLPAYFHSEEDRLKNFLLIGENVRSICKSSHALLILHAVASLRVFYFSQHILRNNIIQRFTSSRISNNRLTRNGLLRVVEYQNFIFHKFVQIKVPAVLASLCL